MGEVLKISIIVAAYNVEQYIDRCLESLTTQDISINDYEIIIINDGSTDNTLKLISDWELKYRNISVISQENKGQSSARNLALRKALGEYIFFVDSDDYIDSNCLGRLIANINNVDILRFNFYDSCVQSFQGEYHKMYNGIEVFEYCYGIWSPCMQIFRKEYLLSNNFYFVEGMTSEDAELLPRVYLKANSVVVVPDKIYHYVYNPVSTTKQRKYNFERVFKRIDSQLKVLESCSVLMKNYKANVKVLLKLDETVIYPTFTAFCVMILLEKLPLKYALQFQSIYSNSSFYPIKIFQNITFKQHIMYQIMNSEILIKLYYFLGFKFIYSALFKSNE